MKITRIFLISQIIISFIYFPNISFAQEAYRHAKKSSLLDSRSDNYSFSKSTAVYSELSNATPLSFSLPWDDPQVLIPIGFPFQIFDKTVDSLIIRDGYCGLSHKEINPNKYEYDYTIAAFMADLIDRGFIISTHQSPISYKLVGTPGTRILKIEWKNAGFYDELDSINSTGDYVNVQLWLYEGTSNIEIHIGPGSVQKPDISYADGGAWILIADLDFENLNIYFDTNFQIILLNGDPQNPIVITKYKADTTMPLNGTPSNGTIYRFTKNPNSSGYNLNPNPELNIYPNPTTEILKVSNLTGNNIQISVTNIFGQKLLEKNFRNSESSSYFTIDISSLPSGSYILQIHSEKDIFSRKFIKR